MGIFSYYVTSRFSLPGVIGIYLVVSESETNLQLYPPYYSVTNFPGNTVASVTDTHPSLVPNSRNTGDIHPEHRQNLFAVRYTLSFLHIFKVIYCTQVHIKVVLVLVLNLTIQHYDKELLPNTPQ
jgi:hypothetical protein